MNVIDKLRERLDTEGIPYESRIEMNENILGEQKTRLKHMVN